MERLTHSLKVIWRSERLLRENEFRQTSLKIQLSALAGLIALFGLVMLSLAAFFALVPTIGQAYAALAVGGADLIFAALLVLFAQAIKPAPELDAIREMRDYALGDLQEEVAHAEQELISVRDDITSFIRSPLDGLLPGMLGPLISGAARGLRQRGEK